MLQIHIKYAYPTYLSEMQNADEIYIYGMYIECVRYKEGQENSERASKRLSGTVPKTSRWPPTWSPVTLGKHSCCPTPFGSLKKPFFSGRHPHGGRHRHPKIMSKSIQNNPKIYTPWHMPTGINLLFDLESLMDGFETQISLLFKRPSHAYLQSSSSSSFKGCP